MEEKGGNTVLEQKYSLLFRCVVSFFEDVK